MSVKVYRTPERLRARRQVSGQGGPLTFSKEVLVCRVDEVLLFRVPRSRAREWVVKGWATPAKTTRKGKIGKIYYLRFAPSCYLVPKPIWTLKDVVAKPTTFLERILVRDGRLCRIVQHKRIHPDDLWAYGRSLDS